MENCLFSQHYDASMVSRYAAECSANEKIDITRHHTHDINYNNTCGGVNPQIKTIKIPAANDDHAGVIKSTSRSKKKFHLPTFPKLFLHPTPIGKLFHSSFRRRNKTSTSDTVITKDESRPSDISKVSITSLLHLILAIAVPNTGGLL